MAVKSKNAAVASAIERAMIPLLEYKGDLYSLSRFELLKIKGVGKQTAELILKVVQGNTLHELVSMVHQSKKRRF